MAAPLPRLRADLDIMPSPVREQPGLIVRDPFRFSEVTLLIPPLLARCLGCFDGEQDEGDLGAAIARLSGQVAVGGRRAPPDRVAARRRVPGRRSLRRSCAARASGSSPRWRSARRRTRAPAIRRTFAALNDTLREYFNGTPAKAKTQPKAKAMTSNGLLGIAAPHVSPEGGSASYAAAYEALREADQGGDEA